MDIARLDFAKLASITFEAPYLSLIEHNQRDITVSTLQRICHALNVPMGILLFLGSSQDEFGNISKELEAELAKNTLLLLSEPSRPKSD